MKKLSALCSILALGLVGCAAETDGVDIDEAADGDTLAPSDLDDLGTANIRPADTGPPLDHLPTVPEGCAKIEGDDIGDDGAEMDLPNGETITFDAWTEKDGGGEYVGYEASYTGSDSPTCTIKAGTAYFEGGLSWTNPNGTSGPTAQGISNIICCPGEEEPPCEETGTCEPPPCEETGTCEPPPCEETGTCEPPPCEGSDCVAVD